ncbi:arylesterase [Cognatishimia sp. WU-CL00825]|uniref:arylesterase n=1 Tax=Cognatishimia sp. WU-CL00825 TaxID=3127658 RepID=UPI003365AFBB
MSKAALAVFLTVGAVAAEPLKVVALGDSLTQGYGLQQNAGFVPQLQNWLSEQGADAQLINAGVSGDTTAGGAARAAWSLSPDTDAMILALGANDMLRGIDPAVSRENLSQILQVAVAQDVQVLLVGMQAPGNFGQDYKARFDAMYPELALDFGALHMESFFEGLGSQDPAELQALMQSDGIHPNQDGVALIVAAIGPHVLELLARAEAQ